MRGPTLPFVVAFAVGCANPPPPSPGDGQHLAVVVADPSQQGGQRLGTAYAAYRADPTSAAAQRAYFEAFPKDYATLRKDFGFVEVSQDSTSFGEFYEQGDEMIGAFFHLTLVPLAEIASKAVGIAREGVWQEDGVNYFQLYLGRGFEQDRATYLAAIRSLPANDQAGFWRFYLDGPVSYPKEDASRLRGLLATEPRQLALVDSVLALPVRRH